MMSNVDGHSWALSAIEEERPSRVSTPLNKELIPLTDSPVVVQQHNIPQQKFVLLSAKVNFKERSDVAVCSRCRPDRSPQMVMFCNVSSLILKCFEWYPCE